MASPNATFTELVTTTLREHPTEIADNVSNENALWRRMNQKKNILKEVDGGHKIAVPLDYAENSSFMRYYGAQALNIQESNVLTAAEFDWVQSVVHVTATGRQLRINSGKNRLINLMKARTKNAMRTAANNMSVDLYSSGSLTNQMGGLGHIIQTAGTGTVGGIDSSTYSFWQNQYKEATGTGPSYTDLKADMLSLYLSTKRGNDKTDLIVSTYDLYAVYWDQLSDNQRYASNDTPNTFTALKFMDADVVPDLNDNFTSTGEKMYFLNTDFLKVIYHPDANWTPDPEKTSVNQDAVVVPLYWMGQMTCSNRARQGVLIDAS